MVAGVTRFVCDGYCMICVCGWLNVGCICVVWWLCLLLFGGRCVGCLLAIWLFGVNVVAVA